MPVARASEASMRVTAWCLIALLFGEQAIALRNNADVTGQILEDSSLDAADLDGDGLQATAANLDVQGGMGPGVIQAIRTLKETYMKEKSAEAGTTCDQLKAYMVNATDKVMMELHAPCMAGSCDFSALNIDEVIAGQDMVTVWAAWADRKECLPLVMGSPEMQQKLQEMLSILPTVLNVSATQEGRDRTREAYLQLVSFQEGILSLKDDLADRKLLLDFDIPASDCPAPCQRCDHHDSTAFGFRCLLKRKDKTRVPELPSRHGVSCDAPKYRWFRWFPFSRQCKVADWKESALQHMQVSAMLSCSTTTIVMGLNSRLPQPLRMDMHRICLKIEEGSGFTSEEEERYRRQLQLQDEGVSAGVKLAMMAIFTLGLASGLAGLRAATRGNERPLVLLEGGNELEPADLSEVFARLLAGEGLTVREEDRLMYGDQQLIDRAETMHKLDVCEDVYNLKSQNTFAEGSRPLSSMTLSLQQRQQPSAAFLGDLVGDMMTAIIIFPIVIGVAVVVGIFALFAVSVLMGIFLQLAAWGGVLVAVPFAVIAAAVAVGGVSVILKLFADFASISAGKRVDLCLREANTTHALPSS